MSGRKWKKRCVAGIAGVALALNAIPDMPNIFAGDGSDLSPVVTSDRYTVDGKYEQPNIVFVLLDDTGVRDLGCFGSEFNETPNIDKIASEGYLFTDYYAQPVCSPSRSSMLTGEGVIRTGITEFLPANNSLCLDHDEFFTLPQMLKKAGYRTSLLGKWHLSAGYTETSRGEPVEFYDDVLMSEQRYIGNGYYFAPYYHLPQVSAEPGTYLIDQMNEVAVDYIKQHKDEPFFLEFSHYATHTVLDAPEDTLEYFYDKRGGKTTDKNTKDNNPYLAAMLKHCDDGVGMIDRTLEELGLKDNTILIIASDNGGSGEFTLNGEFRGAKRNITEGGIRDPLIIRWPKYMLQSKTVSQPVSVIDFYQTLGEAAGIPEAEIPKNSGVSLMPILKNTGTIKRDTLYWAYPRFGEFGAGTVFDTSVPFTEGLAIRVGDYKYIESLAYDRRELFNLAVDPGESNNLINRYPELAYSMMDKLIEKTEDDTVGKRFSFTFAEDEYYRLSASGQFYKQNGKYVTGGSGMNISALEGVLYYGSDIRVNVKVGPTGSGGIVLRANSLAPTHAEFKGYAVILNALSSRVELLNIAGGETTVIASAPYDFDCTKPVALRVVSDSDEIKVYADDGLAPVLTVYDSTYYRGMIGFISMNARTEFSDYSIVGIKATRPYNDKQKRIRDGATEQIVKINGLKTDKKICLKRYVDDTYCDFEMFMSALGAHVDPADIGIKAIYRGKEYLLDTQSMHVTVDGKSPIKTDVIRSGQSYFADLNALSALCAVDTEVTNNVISVENSGGEFLTGGDERVVYEGVYATVYDDKYYGGEYTRLSERDATAELEFFGEGIRLYIGKGPQTGLYDIFIDGELVGTYDGYCATVVPKSIGFEKRNLDYGRHTVKAVCKGKRGVGSGVNVNIDAFEIIKRNGQFEDATTTFIYDTDVSLNYVGNWSTLAGGSNYSNSATRSSTPGNYCIFPFNGTSVKLYIGRGPGAGKFEVYVDGVPYGEYDGYCATAFSKALIFEATGLDSSEHSIKVVNIDGNLNIDAFEVGDYRPVLPAVSERIECESGDERISFIGSTWKNNGSAMRSTAVGEECSFSFDGINVQLNIGVGPGAGWFDIYIDGEKVATVNGYNKTAGPDTAAFVSDRLDKGTHIIRVVNLGDKNGGAKNLNINAFIVTTQE